MSCNEWRETELGLIPMDWDVKTIGEIGKVVGGGTPNTKEYKYWDGDISWITPKDLSGFNERYIYKGERSITKEGLENSSSKLLPKGTVLFSSRAPIGYVAIAGKELATNQGFKSIICNDEIAYNIFVYYLMKYKKNEVEQIANGSTFKEVSGKVLSEFKVVLPPLHEQKAIAKILSDLDEKIEINNRINKVLEEIAQTIFKRWFIDFEFPNENGEPYKSSGGEMVDSELGPIPKGWEVGRFRDYIETIISGDWGKENLTGNYKKSVYCVRGADIPEIKKGIKKNLPIRFINEKNYLNKKLIENDLVVEISGGSPTQATGRILYINVELLKGYDKDLICSNFCKVIRLKDVKLMPYFFFYWEYLYNEGVFFQFENGTTGIKNLDINSFIDNFIILKPQEEVLQKYNLFVRKLLSIIHYNGLENQNLSQLRDALLPKLMSGEIRVDLNNDQIVLKNED